MDTPSWNTVESPEDFRQNLQSLEASNEPNPVKDSDTQKEINYVNVDNLETNNIFAEEGEDQNQLFRRISLKVLIIMPTSNPWKLTTEWSAELDN